MIKDFSFSDIRKFLEKEKNTAVLDAFDKLADAALIFSPIFLGAQFLPIIELLDVKDRLFGLGRTVIDFITSRQEPDYIERSEQLKAAYSLICYTAYFESLEKTLPKDIRKKLKLSFDKKVELADSSTQLSVQQECVEIDIHNKLPYSDHVTSFSETQKYLLELYQDISSRIFRIIKESEILSSDQRRIDQLENCLIKDLPQKSIECYKAQYLYLADTFSDFGFFAQGLEFDSLQKASQQHAESLQLITSATRRIDVGLVNLFRIVNSIATNYSTIQSQDIVDDLKNMYRATIEQSIIDDKEILSKHEKVKLAFPKIVDAFIPQSYKCLTYDSKLRLEDEATWSDLEVKDDLDRFFVKYLFYPDSINYPLIILGHPGSGKSLLTKVLSAQLMSESYTAIRIPLREVNADSTIDLLVEDQIKKGTNRTLPSGGYGAFAKQFKEKPLIIILDGYDELLQAKGDVFASYLDKAMRFQKDQKDMNRPVRIIVTSRITLIDKAIVPANSTVLRLLEFNAKQRNAWIKIWNKTNSSYFQSSQPQINPFSLPRIEDGSGANKNSIIELAEQPLLLLMLALYDSENNSLAELDNDLKRTALYNNLLRRFVRRERGRYVSGFNEMSLQDQNGCIECEMRRLGVVAIGMFNRKKLFIHTEELDNDLVVFDSRRRDPELSGKKLKDSESLLGGFFFIHQSTAQDISANSDNSNSTFEFLHNTFGEFLTADMILKFAVQEAQALNACKTNQFLANELTRKLNSPDGLCKEWFACLMFTPLFSRPVVLEMIQEHAPQVMRDSGISEDDFLSNFEIVIKSQLKMILAAHSFPCTMTQEHGISNDIPLLGFISIYTLNLIILASVLCKNGFIFDEEVYNRQDVSSSETKPWDKLTFLWRTWFSSENLTGLSTIFNAKRNGSKITIKCHDKFEASSLNQPIDIQLCVSYALSDILNVGLAGLQSRRFSRIIKMSPNDIGELLRQENSDLYFGFLVICLRNSLYADYRDELEKRLSNINGFVEEIIKNIDPQNTNNETLLSFFEAIEIAILRNAFYSGTKKNVVGYISKFLNASYLKPEYSPVVLSAFRILQKLITNDNSMILDKNMLYEEPIFMYEFRDLEMDFPLEKLMHFTWSIKSSKLYYNDFTRGLDYQESLNQIIENSYIDTREKQSILNEVITIKNIHELANINPVLVSRILLHLFDRKADIKLIELLTDKILEEVEKYGFRFIGYEAIINIIELALKTQNLLLKTRVCDILNCLLRNYPPEYVGYILYSNPELFDAMLDIFPELFDKEQSFYKYIDRLFYKQKRFPLTKKATLSYIKLIRKLSDTQHENRRYLKESINRFLLRQMVEQQYQFDLEKLTIEDLDNLSWFAQHQKNRELYLKIKQLLSALG